MKKFLFGLLIMALLVSGYARAEKTADLRDLCKKEAQIDEIADALI